MNPQVPKNILKITGLALLLFAVLFVAANFGFFWKNFAYYLRIHRAPTAATNQSTAADKPTMQANFLEIPSLGISAPVVYAQEPNEKSYQSALLTGVAHFPGTANPGQFGNCYIFGHSSDFIWSKGKYKTVFALLPHIEIGDDIYISDSQGNKFTYTIQDSREVAASDLSVLSQQTNQKRLLTLQTSYPVGTALARWAVVGEIK